MAFTTAHRIHLKAFEANDSAWYGNIGCNHVSDSTCSLSSPVNDGDLHLFKVGIEPKLTQVIDSTAIKFVLRRQEHREGRPADYL